MKEEIEIQRLNINFVIGKIRWTSSGVDLNNKTFLFWFGDKCVSGSFRIVKRLRPGNEYEIEMAFSQDELFREVAIIGERFVIKESAKVLGEGLVIKTD